MPLSEERRRAHATARLDRREFIAMAGAAAAFWPWGTSAASQSENPAWTAPRLTDPQVLEIRSDSSQSFIDLDPNADYLVRIGPSSDGVVVRHALRLQGGRNVVVIGGCIRRARQTPTDAPDGAKTRFPGELFTVRGHTGTAYVEGLLLDNGDNYGVDGIHVGSETGGTYVFRNIHVRGVAGNIRGNHADGLQVIRPVDHLLIDGMTVYSTYQGINLQPEFPIGFAWLRNCNTRYPNPDFRSGDANGYSFWLGDSRLNPKLDHPARYRFENVYVEERTHFWNLAWENGSVGPPSKAPGGCRLVPGHPDWAEFPAFDVEGHVSRGIPPGGDFCPASRILSAAGRVEYRALPGV